ncbi:MAG: hypothetical protein Q4C34_04060 [Bacteroidales bacterium]|nr:hypothetical protein [Bacteroidales bacterium]
MKKTILFKAMALFMAMTASVSLVSCSDDDDPKPSDDPTALKAISVSYGAQISSDYLDVYDVNVTYTTVAGATKTEPMTSTVWTHQETFDKSKGELPTEFSCEVIGTPRAGVNIDPDARYRFEEKGVFIVEGIRNDDKTTMLKTSTPDAGRTFKGSDVITIMESGNRDILTFSYTRPVK